MSDSAASAGEPSRGPLTTNVPRAALAAVIGAATGGVLSAIAMLAVNTALQSAQGLDSGWSEIWPYLLPGLAVFAIPASLVYLVGLGCVAAPCWVGLHRQGFRGWRTAICLGSVLNGGVFLLLGIGTNLLTVLPSVGLFGVIGAVVGWVIWRVAYSRALPKDYLEVW